MKIEEESRDERKKQFKNMMNDLKQDKSNELLISHRTFKDQWKSEVEPQMQAYYYSKMRSVETLIRQDWHLKLNKEGKEITPEMGKPSFMSKKKFIEDTYKKVENRNDVLARLARETA